MIIYSFWTHWQLFEKCIMEFVLNCDSLFFSGAIFEQGTDEVQSAFMFAMLNHNQNTTKRTFELQAYVDVINTADAFKLSRLSKWRFILIYKFFRFQSFFFHLSFHVFHYSTLSFLQLFFNPFFKSFIYWESRFFFELQKMFLIQRKLLWVLLSSKKLLWKG